MPRKDVRTYADGLLDGHRAGVEADRAAVLADLNQWIVDLRYAGNPLSDLVIRWRDTKLRPTERVIADLVPAPKADQGRLEPLPKVEISDADIPF